MRRGAKSDWGEKLWTIAGTRMKGGREHRVPLCDRALTILREMKPSDNIPNAAEQFVFSGRKPGRPLSEAAFWRLLRRMGRGDVTAHGFRSSFRDWAGDRTAFARDVVEAALAHAIENKTEAAYRRSDALEKRRKLLAAWAAFCATAPTPERQGNVTPLRAS